MGQNQGRQEETQHPTHRFRRLFLDLLLIGWRGCASAMGVIKTVEEFLVSIISNKIVLFAAVDRGSIMATMHKWSVMIRGSLQAEFMETMYNSHIHK